MAAVRSEGHGSGLDGRVMRCTCLTRLLDYSKSFRWKVSVRVLEALHILVCMDA